MESINSPYQYSEKKVWIIRRFVEAFVLFLCVESLFRRAFPEYSGALLATKFLLVPVLYVLILLRVGIHVFLPKQFGAVLVIYSAWGTALALMRNLDEVTGCLLAIAVNVLFVPFFSIGKCLFSSSEQLLRICWLFAGLSFVLGLVAFYQFNLPVNHWSVMQTDGQKGIHFMEGASRVPSTFQFCNTYGSFTVVGVAACIFCLFRATSSKSMYLAFLFLLVNFCGGVFSGSRLASVGAIIVGIVMMLAEGAKASRLFAPSIVAGAIGFVLLVSLPNVRAFESVVGAAAERSLKTDDEKLSLVGRVTNYYFGSDFERAVHASEWIGYGWGPYTRGTYRFYPEWYLDSLPFVEGGYARLMAEVGLVGLIGFIAFLWLEVQNGMRQGRNARFLTLGLICYLAFATLPIPVWQITTIAVPWWLLFGASAGNDRERRER